MASLADQFLDDVESSSGSDDESLPPPTTAQTEAPQLSTLQRRPISTSTTTDASLSAWLNGVLDPALLPKLDILLARVSSLSETVQFNESDAEQAVTDCASAIFHIDEAILSLHRALTIEYSPAFPELETLITNPLDYARVAARAVLHDDLSAVDFRPILPSASVITVQVTASSTAGRPLPSPGRVRVIALTSAMQDLDEKRAALLSHLSNKASVTAPNLCAVVGPEIAAQLLAHAGGINALARMPSGNVKALGKKRHVLSSNIPSVPRSHDGVVHSAPVVLALPPKLRPKAGDIVAGKATLAARVDAARGFRDGNAGRELRAAIDTKFANMQERPPARTAKPLPVPGDEAKRRHRGGARARKEKERMGLTEMRKLANRVTFGQAELITGNDLENEGLGMLTANSQAVRIRAKKTDSVAVAAKRRLDRQKKREVQSEADLLGITSSLVLSPGPEQTLPTSADAAVGTAAAKTNGRDIRAQKSTNYFSTTTPFLGVNKRQKISKE